MTEAGLRIAPPVVTKGYGGGTADQADWTPGDVASKAANPVYAINIDEGRTNIR